MTSRYLPLSRTWRSCSPVWKSGQIGCLATQTPGILHPHLWICPCSKLACLFFHTVTVVHSVPTCLPPLHTPPCLVSSYCLLPLNHYSFLLSSSFEAWFFHSLITCLVPDVIHYFGLLSSPFLYLGLSPFLLLYGCVLLFVLVVTFSPHFILFILLMFILWMCVWNFTCLSTLEVFFVNWSHFCLLPSILSVFHLCLWHLMGAGDEWVHISLPFLFTHSLSSYLALCIVCLGISVAMRCIGLSICDFA